MFIAIGLVVLHSMSLNLDERSALERVMTETTLSERSCTLYVTSCRRVGTSAGPTETRSGFKLYRELRRHFASPLNRRVEVKPAGCLSICP